MNAILDTAKDILTRALGVIYPAAAFDAEELIRMLVPCALVLAAALILYLFLKCFRGTRRLAQTAVTAALIVLVSASAFFPDKLIQAGDYATAWIQQRFWAEEEPPTEEAGAPEAEGGLDARQNESTIFI